MSRLFAVVVGLVAIASSVLAQTPLPRAGVPARAADATEAAPEKLLSPTSQLYLRWDGIGAHNEAYKKSVWGGVMAGSTGDSIRAIIAKVPKQLGNNLLADPLLEGKPPQELKANLADLKNASKLIDLIADKGAIIAAEVREPTPTLKGVGSAIGGLFGGKLPGAEAIIPDVQLLVIVPDVAEKAEAFNAAIRLLLKKGELKSEPFAAAGRNGFRLAALPEGPAVPIQAAWWVEGKHFVFYAGTMKPEAVVGELTANAAKGGVTGHPLYQRCSKNPGYESIARGFVDTARVVSVAKSLAGPFVPGLAQRLDDLGFGNLKAIVFNSGFDGKESRATYDFDLPGERKGLAKIIKQTPLTLKDLPPLPPDVSRFSALRVDPTATYEAGIMAIEAFAINESFGPEEDAKTAADKIRLRREYLAKEIDKGVGVNIKDDVVPYLGDKVVVFQSPTEGLSAFGTVICVSLKDPAKIKTVADRIQRGLETLISAPVKVRKKIFHGVELRELYSRGFGIVTPTYAIVGDWLVVALQPQGVQGFILRTQGEIPSWKPDAATTARLAKLPTDSCGIQYCDPKSTAQNLCCIGPLFLGTVELRNRFRETESDFDPIDVGLVPNAHELSKHLFPNLTVTRDDGKTIRIEVNESFSLPLEVVGLEPLALAGLLALLGG
ncbi:MAG TPA: hypothetical protein VG122_11145 [Gemmata sp.]|jgi:hypothetical protein|nr:hypothetical protein [Gemmata sp.]